MKLQDYRKLLGLSRAKAAAQLGTTGVTIYRWETGRMYPSVSVANRVVEWSKGAVRLEDLLGSKA